ncbi:MAG: HEAT repeat protein/tRNA A-37 threonylcarbamoyl transferase component Bud32 [Bradymonadia bacterium]|jgi:HEAT repeat protein/tRNA A-37 threonylcarbamoyl transferase component Bud32
MSSSNDSDQSVNPDSAPAPVPPKRNSRLASNPARVRRESSVQHVAPDPPPTRSSGTRTASGSSASERATASNTGGFSRESSSRTGGFDRTPSSKTGGFDRTPSSKTGGFDRTPSSKTGGFDRTPSSKTGGVDGTPSAKAAGFDRTTSIRSGGFERRDSSHTTGFTRLPTGANGFDSEPTQLSDDEASDALRTDHAEARLGQMLLGWRLDKVVGDGRTATVYLASSPEGERAAVKVMHRQYRGDSRVRKRLLREAQLARQLNALPGVTRVHNADVTRAGEPFVIMERLLGRDLDRLRSIAAGGFSTLFALCAALETAETLGNVHALGIVHRNVSPFNVFVTPDGQLKLLDFGSSAAADRSDVSSVQELGSDIHAYMAPEIAAGQIGDERSDVFGVGALLYALLSGSFLNNEECSLREGTAPLLDDVRPDLPVALRALIARATDLAAAIRQPTMKALEDALRDCLASDHGSVAHSAAERRLVLGQVLLENVDIEAEASEQLAGAFRSTGALRDMFRLVENVLNSARRHGWEHDDTEVRLQHLVDIILDAVADDPDGIFWLVRPVSFDYLDEQIWSPGPPFDKMTYNLFDSGFRKMHLLPGLSDDECRAFLRWLVLDPQTDLPAEDDLATVYWSMEFEFVRCELVSAVVLQDVEDYEQLDDELKDLQSEAIAALRRSMRKRMTGEVDAFDSEDEHFDAAVAVRRLSAMAIPPALRTAVDETIQQAIPLWRGRLAHILARAERDAEWTGDMERVMHPWSRFVSKALDDGDVDDVLEVFGVLCERAPERHITKRFAAPFFDGRAFWRLLSIVIPIAGPTAYGERATFYGRRLQTLLRLSPQESTSVAIDAMARCQDRTLLAVLLQFVEARLVGHEPRLGEVLRDAAPVLGIHVGKVLGRNPSRESVSALLDAAHNPSTRVRITAAEFLAKYAPSRAKRELTDLLRDEDLQIRRRAVEALRVNRLESGVELLAARVEEREFRTLSNLERKHALTALFELSDEKAEAILIELVGSHGLVRDAEVDASRLIGVELLEELGLSDEALTAVRGASKKRWWNSPELQAAANRAEARIEQRLKRIDEQLAQERHDDEGGV